MAINNLHIYTSAFTNETRMLKETGTLAQSGIFEKVYIGVFWKEGLPEHEVLDERREVFRIKLLSSRLPVRILRRMAELLEWMCRLLWIFRKHDIAVVSCHSLAVLPAGVLLKLFFGSRIVYETHELETERNGWSGWQRRIGKIIERPLIRFVDQVIVVGPSIARWYELTYALDNVHVVRNVPVRAWARTGDAPRLRQRFGLGSDEILLLYQGILSKGRFVETLLQIASQLDHNKHMVFMGYGPLEPLIKSYAEKYPNIHFHPAVKPQEIVDYTSGADIGLAIFENTSLSYYFSSPNKLFEYIMCGVPAVISDFPDMAEIIDRHGCGWKVAVDSEEITALLNRLSVDEVRAKKARTAAASQHFAWENEEPILVDAYRRLPLASRKLSAELA